MFLVIDPNTGALQSRPERIHHRLRARLQASSLDRQLAAGWAPEASPALAARARRLVTPATRRALARDLEHLVQRAAERPDPRRIVVTRPEVVAAAAPALRQAGILLRTSFPAAARGVAMLSLVLSDGTGPLYNPHHPVALADAVRDAVTELGPLPFAVQASS